MTRDAKDRDTQEQLGAWCVCVCAIRDSELVSLPDPQYWGLAKDLGMGLDNVFEITTHIH